MSDAQAKLNEAVVDLCWRVTPYGETEDGDIADYIVSKGTVHRLVGAAQGAGVPAHLRNAHRVVLARDAYVTDEIQAVLDVLTEKVDDESMESWTRRLQIATHAYLASRGEQ